MREMFAEYTVVRLLDGTYAPTQYQFPNHNIRVWNAGEEGIGLFSDNSCDNCNSDPSYCGDWTLPEISLSPSVTDSFVRSGDTSASNDDIGIEIYSADYVSFTPASGFPSDEEYVLSLAYDVHDEDAQQFPNHPHDNIYINIAVVGYSGSEMNPILIEHNENVHWGFPSYTDLIYHQISSFGLESGMVSEVHSIVGAMEYDYLVPHAPTYYIYPMRSYSINATAVPKYITISEPITCDTRWYHGQIVTVSGGRTISSGVVLTIEPGVIVEFQNDAYLTVSGTLNAIGSSIYPITFKSENENPDPGDWVGIFSGEGRVHFEHCIIEYPEKGIALYDYQPHFIQNCTIQYCSDKGLLIKGGSNPVTIDDPICGNYFYQNDYGMYLDGVVIEEMYDNEFEDNTTGLYAWGACISSENDFRDLYFANNQYGIYFEAPGSGSTKIRNCTFFNNTDCGIYFNQRRGSGSFEMHDLTVESNGQCGSCYAGIRSHGYTSEPKTRHCQIRNFIDSGDVGISCRVAGRVNAGYIEDHGLNYFDNNDCDLEYYIEREGSFDSLFAHGNCWDGYGGFPALCGNHDTLIATSEDCSGWGGPFAPPLPETDSIEEMFEVYPNPVETNIRMEYAINSNTKVSLQVYDLTGHLVRTVLEETKQPGSYTIEWDGLNNSGKEVKNGVYVCRIVTESFVKSKRIVLIR